MLTVTASGVSALIAKQIREVSFSGQDALNSDFSGLYRVANHITPINKERGGYIPQALGATEWLRDTM